METEQTLENLITSMEQNSSQKKEYEAMQARLGTDEGPEILNPRLVGDLSARVGRLSTLGRIRKLIAEEVIPYIEGKLQGATAVIEEAVNNKIREQIGAGAMYLSTEELELVKPTVLLDLARDYRRGLVTPDQYVSEVKQVLGITETSKTESQTYTAPVEIEITSEQKVKIQIIEENRFLVNGKEITLSPKQSLVLKVLLSKIDETVTSSDLAQEAHNLNAREAGLSMIIKGLKYKLNQPGQETLLTGGYTTNAWVKLQNVEVVKSEEDKVKNWIVDIQRQADSGILTNRNLLERVNREAAALNIEFNLPEAIVNEEEAPQLVEITADEIEFTAEEAVVLARLWMERNTDRKEEDKAKKFVVDGRTFKFGLTPDEEQSIKRVLAGWQGSIDDPEKTRDSVLTKIEVLFNAENADDLILKFEGDLRELLVGLFYMDRKVSPSYLLDYLRNGLAVDPKSHNFNEDIFGWIRRLIRAELGEELPKPAPKPVIITQYPAPGPISKEKKVFEGPFVFPDGQTVENLTKTEREIAEILKEVYMRGVDKVIPGEEIFKPVWGDLDLQSGLNKLRPVLSVLKKKMPANWSWENKGVRGAGGLYRLIRSLENQIASEPVPTITEELVDEVVDTVTEVRVETPELVALEISPEPENVTEVSVEHTPSKISESNQEKISAMTTIIKSAIKEANLETWPENMSTSSMVWHIKNNLHRTVKETPIRKFVDGKFIHPGGTKKSPEFNRQDGIIAYYLNSLGNRINNLSDVEKDMLPKIVENEYKSWEAKNRNGNGH